MGEAPQDANRPAERPEAPAPLPLFGDGEEHPKALGEVAADLDIEALADQIISNCMALVFSGQSHDEAFQERLRASVTQNAYALRDVVAGTLSLEDVTLDKVLSFATVQAQLRIPQKSMQRSYRVSFYVQWRRWVADLDAYVERADLSRAEALEAFRSLTQVILGYQDHVASQVAETYTRDYEALNRSRAHVRRNLVQEVLRGNDSRLSATDLALLGYPLERHHVAVVLPSMAEGAADRVADGVRTATRAQQSLVYPLSLTSTVIWLSRIEPWHEPAFEGLVEVLDRLGVVAAISDQGSGTAGFRQSLRQAQDTSRVRAAWQAQSAPQAPHVLRYADAGLEILLMQNDELARSFVENELGELAADTPEAARLRETLEASFRFGSHVAAAEHLQLHEHTVRNRLNRAQQLLGHSLQERRTELQVAVRILRILGAPPPDQADPS